MIVRESIFEQLRRIPEDLQETHERLENWAAWSRDRIRRGHCRSIEYRYKSSDIWQDSEPRAEWDSLAAMGLVALLEESFEIQLSTEEIMSMRSVGLVREVLRTKGVGDV